MAKFKIVAKNTEKRVFWVEAENIKEAIGKVESVDFPEVLKEFHNKVVDADFSIVDICEIVETKVFDDDSEAAESLPSVSDNNKQTMTETSITFTRQDLIDQLTPIFIQSLQDSAESIIAGETNPKAFVLSHELSDNDIITKWCDFISIGFFDNNPDIDDVLFLISSKNEDLRRETQKEWIASR